ncbi:MAG: SPASM domain-containing protein [Candidatus Pacearchaeota archaeon]|nr:SPASM domain-containing protein [Candidatus Pacearchaeota archaeon]
MPSIDITTKIGCVNMCDYCPQDKLLSAYKSREYVMSFATFKKCIDKIPKQVLIFFAGMSEPFQNKNCTKMIEYANKKGFLIKVFTTTIGMTKKDIPRLEKIPFGTFEIHLSDDSNNTKIKVDKHYLEIIKSIKNSKIQNLTFLLYGKMHPQVKKVLNKEVEDLSRLIQNRASNLSSVPPSKKLKGSIICNTNNGQMLHDNVLLPNGDVVLCCMDYGLKHKLGNLLESSYESLFQTEYFKNMQKAMNSKEGEILCRHCSYARKSNSKTFLLKRNLKKLGLLGPLYSLTKVPIIKKNYISLMNLKNIKNLKYNKS